MLGKAGYRIVPAYDGPQASAGSRPTPWTWFCSIWPCPASTAPRCAGRSAPYRTCRSSSCRANATGPCRPSCSTWARTTSSARAGRSPSCWRACARSGRGDRSDRRRRCQPRARCGRTTARNPLAGADAAVTTIEYRLLAALVERSGEVVERDDLLSRRLAGHARPGPAMAEVARGSLARQARGSRRAGARRGARRGLPARPAVTETQPNRHLPAAESATAPAQTRTMNEWMSRYDIPRPANVAGQLRGLWLPANARQRRRWRGVAPPAVAGPVARRARGQASVHRRAARQRGSRPLLGCERRTCWK